MKLKYIKVSQPIGDFYLSSIKSKLLVSIVEVKRRYENSNAIQREESESRTNEISKYCEDTDATFPTPIIISVYENANTKITSDYINIDENKILGEVIDGQHRLGGLKKSLKIDAFEMPIVLMFNLTEEEKAYIFSIINSKQTRVNMSLIYDLFSLSEKRSPFKTCHEIARALNKKVESPFYNRLKMLGKKESSQKNASLSQGTFIKYLLELISKNPDEDTRKIKNNEELIEDENYIFRSYFITNNDSTILKILLNVFSAVKTVFPDEWNHSEKYILSKSIGFGGILKALPNLINIGKSDRDLSQEYFEKVFMRVKTFMKRSEIEFTSEHFGSNEQARTKLTRIILQGIA